MTPKEASTQPTSTYHNDASGAIRPVSLDLNPHVDHRVISSQLLRPEDAFYASSPHQSSSRSQRSKSPLGRYDVGSAGDTTTSSGRRKRESRRSRSANKRKEKWKKLLWVKQPYPDNYTDEETFLDQLKRNPRLRPYEFWSLVADSTIIVQHVASAIIFLCCFTAIFQERISPVSMVSWATSCSVVAWILRDYWVGQLCDAQSPVPDHTVTDHLGISVDGVASSSSSTTDQGSVASSDKPVSTDGANSSSSSLGHGQTTTALANTSRPSSQPLDDDLNSRNHLSRFSPRNQERLATVKSAILIYAALLGLSPILKSLTKSTSPDSIWAISSWLIIINVFTFDYGAGVETKVPASLSTNAALMASTVLASRLPSTTHVFSITLFSIEIFGLFPVFRRHLRHHSYGGHLLLTLCLVIGAGGGLCATITGGGWTAGIVGTVLGVFLTGLTMGMTSWWLIGLQRYKNEIRGPWDPARPVIRRHWD